jgi:hypothetical protein
VPDTVVVTVMVEGPAGVGVVGTADDAAGVVGVLGGGTVEEAL